MVASLNPKPRQKILEGLPGHEPDAENMKFVWVPQEGPQAAFVQCPYDEIFFGGARGGGKTQAVLGAFLIKALHYGRGVKGIAFRRTLPQLEAMIKAAKEIFLHFAEWIESKKEFRFHNGAFLIFRYLDKDDDAENYQGHDYTDLIIEEITNFPSPVPIMKLKATLRSGSGIPCRMMATGNPGGPGMTWVRARYIEPAPMGWFPMTEEFETTNPHTGEKVITSSTRIFIPSKVWDNKLLLKNDPSYIARLHESGSDNLVKAWLDGDWFAIDGAYFDNWDQKKHVVRPFAVPDWWARYRCGDWGSAHPFAFYWFAVASENFVTPDGALIPKGALVFYREWYGCKTKKDGTIIPNTGLKLTAEEVGAGVWERERSDPQIRAGVLDPGAFAQDGGISNAEAMFRGMRKARDRAGSQRTVVTFRPADNKRTPGRGAMGGWDQVRARLNGEEVEPERKGDDGTIIPAKVRPMIYFFATCSHLIRTLPMMQHDADHPEDMDSDGEDHAADAVRYGCMARPYCAPTPARAKRMTTLSDVTLEQMWDANESQLSH